MDPADLLWRALLSHTWWFVAAVVVGAAVRASKADTILPVDVPRRYRALLALGLGQVSGLLEHLLARASWRSAAVGGLVSAVVAVLGHEWVVERILAGPLGGGDVPLPRALRRGQAKLAKQVEATSETKKG